MAYGDDYSEQTGRPGDADDKSARERMMTFILRSALKPSIPLQRTDESQPGQPPSPPAPGFDVRPKPPQVSDSTDSGDGSRGSVMGAQQRRPGILGARFQQEDDAAQPSNVPRATIANLPPTPVMGNLPPAGQPGGRFPDVRPNIRPPRATNEEAPNLPPTPTMGNLPPSVGRQPQPTRPDVMPARSDFPEKKLPTWEKVLGIGAAPFVPALSAAILTSPRRSAERQYEGAVKDWQMGQEGQERQARIRNIDSEIQARANPKPEKPEGLTQQEAQAVEELVAQGVPRVDAIGRVRGAGQKPPTPTFEEQNYSEWAEAQKKAGKPSDRMTFEKQLHPKDTTGRDEARGDRSYQWHAGRIDKLREPITARMERVSRLEDTLNQGTPQADALVAPELLSVMAGGQGSGLRMNEAEIARIVGGRTNWETLKAKLGAWQTDPNKGFALTPAQREQTRALFAAVKDRVSKKMAAIDEESEALSGTDSAAEHRRIYNRLQKRLSDIDAGGGQGGQVIVTDPNGGQHTFPDQASADRFKKLANIQ